MATSLVPSNALDQLRRLFAALLSHSGSSHSRCRKVDPRQGEEWLRSNICGQAYEAGVITGKQCQQLTVRLRDMGSYQPGQRTVCRIIVLLLDIRKHVGLVAFAAQHGLWPDQEEDAMVGAGVRQGGGPW